MIYKASQLNSLNLDKIIRDFSHLGEEGHEHLEIRKDSYGIYYPATASKPRRIRWFLCFFFRWKPKHQRLDEVRLFLEDFIRKNSQRENEIVTLLHKNTKFSQLKTSSFTAKKFNMRFGLDLGKFHLTEEMIERRLNEKCEDPHFQQEIKDFFARGNLIAVSDQAPKGNLPTLEFVPDDALKISRADRIELIGDSCLIAPEQPKERPFVYVSLGSGALRHDLHQILALITQEPQRESETAAPPPPLIKNISIRLIDTAYSSNGAFSGCYSKSFPDYLVEFLAILKLQAPETLLDIHFFDSTKAYMAENEDTSIDFLSGIRLPEGQEINKVLDQLSDKLSGTSGALCTDYRNKRRYICKKEGEIVIDQETNFFQPPEWMKRADNKRLKNLSKGVSMGGALRLKPV